MTLRRSALARAGVFVALLACGLCRPSEARAACGDHVIVVFAHARGATSFDPRLLGGPMPRAADRSPAIPSGRPRPCSGALCSGQPAIPLVPASTIADRIEGWAYEIPCPGPRDPAAVRVTPDEDHLRPSHRGPSVFHPPRPTP
ncbi:MAG TPA: hypothetical protein VF590_26230 [Isosphaeraceae bacterium]|jgi:hypothetical protein